jgi:hypothetical protein
MPSCACPPRIIKKIEQLQRNISPQVKMPSLVYIKKACLTIYDNIFPCQVGDVNLTLWIGPIQNTHGGRVAPAVWGAGGFSGIGLVATVNSTCPSWPIHRGHF